MTQDGSIVRLHYETPKLMQIVHDIELSDGREKEYVANVIDGKILIRVDSKDFSLVLMESIAHWKKEETTIDMIDKRFVTSNYQTRLRKNNRRQNLRVL